MKSDSGNDDRLRELLKEWRPKGSLPPRFQEQVWRSIERADAQPAGSLSLAAVFTAWITNLLPKPALALAYVTILLLIGGTVGWNQARQESARITDQLSARYAQTVDPYKTASHR